MSEALSHQQLKTAASNRYGKRESNYGLSKMRVSYFVQIGGLEKQGVVNLAYRHNLTMDEIGELVLEKLELLDFTVSVKIIITQIVFGTDDMRTLFK